MENTSQIIPNFIPAFEALRLGAMAVQPSPRLGLWFWAAPETGTPPHACGLGAMLYAAGVREKVSCDVVGRRAIALWPFLAEPIESPAAVTQHCDTAIRGTIAAAIENLAISGMSYTAIAAWLEPIERAHLAAADEARGLAEGLVNLPGDYLDYGFQEGGLNRRGRRIAFADARE